MKPIQTVLAAALLTTLPPAAAAGTPGGNGAAAHAPAVARLTAAERAHVRAHGEARLEALRGATGVERGGLAAGERDALREVARHHRELERLRAGDVTLSDRELKIILITAAVVVTLAIIF
jgi:hypothetical protein